ncbi:DUF6888 family protein [Calothrix sp. CCY 0018]|uniref:DUF6888 family protein n=1 Tax=Calothrix sp. CCY 0018 TaxID=3103864 RepID=UPI0039C65036
MIKSRLFVKKTVEPTIEQLRTFYILCLETSNLLKTVELTRYDRRTGRIVVLIGDTIEVEILTNGERIIR